MEDSINQALGKLRRAEHAPALVASLAG
jgi:hypothetical protein